MTVTFSRPLLLLTAISLLGFGCDDGLTSAAVPSMEIQPSEFVFDRQSAISEREVYIRNTGEGTLVLSEFSYSDGFEEEFVLKGELEGTDIRDGDALIPSRLEIESGEELVLTLIYTPSTTTAPSGWVAFGTNDPDDRNVSLPIRGEARGPEIQVSPRSVDFGRVVATQEATRPVTVTNIGQETLTVREIKTSGSGFSAKLGQVNPVLDNTILADPDSDGTAGLSPGKSFEITVSLLTELEGTPIAGALSIKSDDSVQPEVVVDLKANAESPCLSVSRELDFGAGLINGVKTRPLSIESCGSKELIIYRVAMGDESSPVYTIDEDTVPDLPMTVPGYNPDEDPMPPSRTINVDFSPTEELAYTGTIVIDSNDPAYEPVGPDQPGVYRAVVPVVGRGTVNECPVSTVARADFSVLPLDIITLDASGSVDPDGPEGKPIAYRWTVVDRPAGSTAVPVEAFRDPTRPADGGRADDTSTPTAFFFVDLAGEYHFELEVEDNLGTIAPSDMCPQAAATIHVTARPENDVHIQMVWHTPNDRNETDGDGTDVDLHLLHPNARAWMLAPLDCYYGNMSPDWGPAGRPGNPTLDIDDRNGAGPENINIDDPENTTTLNGSYRVGVHYYTSSNELTGADYGVSEVTVRIFLGGIQVGEWAKSLQRTNNFWDVASIIWSPNDQRVQEVNRFYETVPR